MTKPNDRTAPGQGSVPVDSPPTTDPAISNDPDAAQPEAALSFPDAHTVQGQRAPDADNSPADGDAPDR